MKKLVEETSLEELTSKWNMKHQVLGELQALDGSEYIDVTAYNNCLDIDVWLGKTEDKLAREEELMKILPEKLFDSWDGEMKWHRTLLEYSGDFKVFAKGLRVVDDKAMRVTVNLYHANDKGCKVTKVTRTIEVYVSDCDVLEEDPRP